ncbi:MAG: hypothetical protein Q9191_002309 [Dirinaria sp. TL-2023a]
MRLPLWFLCASLSPAIITAFYPVRPTNIQNADASSLQSTGSFSGNSGNQEKRAKSSVRLSIKRRAPPYQARTYDWSIVETNAIFRRWQRQPRIEHGTRVKRGNEYNVVTAAKPSQTNSVPINEDGTDFSYFASLYFGSQDTMMYMLIDTGAANTWVMGSNCTSAACQKHNTFGSADSTTFKSTGRTFNLTYGTGSVSGVTVNDTVRIAGMSVPLSFGAASTTSDDFLEYPMDGILGLGRAASNTMQFPTAMEAIEATKALPANLFGVALQRESDGSTNGELSFGAPDSSQYTGDLSFSDTLSNGKLWEIPVDDAAFSGKKCKFTGKSAIVDTGTTFVLLPPDDSKVLHSQIPQSVQDGEMFHLPCSTKEPIQIIISGVSYNITSKDYVGKPVKGGDMCESNIIGRQAFASNQWLLGDVFLKNVYTVFDFDKERIGALVSQGGRRWKRY